MPLDAGQVPRRFLLLRVTRWLPTGLLIPVLVLLLLQRGLSLGQIGLVTAGQGAMIMLLELPTGGLTDIVGRRRVLLAATLIELLSMILLVVADSMVLLAVVFALQGIYRALESGPLDAWYVDTAQAADPGADIESGLSRGGAAIGIAIAAGSLLSSGLVALDPVPTATLTLPVVIAVVLRVVDVVAIWRLMAEPPPTRSPIGQTLRSVPRVIREAIGLVRGSRLLIGLLGVELLWGAGMVAFEGFTPPRLEAVLGSADRAAATYGPASVAGWIASAMAAAALPLLARRMAPRWVGVLTRLLQAATVAAIALLAGPVGVVGAFVATMAVHGAANAAHQGILHRAVTGPERRATVVSVNSLAASIGGAVGGIALGALADATTLSTAILVGAVLLAVPAPLYLLGGRTTSASTSASAPAPASVPATSLPPGS